MIPEEKIAAWMAGSLPAASLADADPATQDAMADQLQMDRALRAMQFPAPDLAGSESASSIGE